MVRIARIFLGLVWAWTYSLFGYVILMPTSEFESIFGSILFLVGTVAFGVLVIARRRERSPRRWIEWAAAGGLSILVAAGIVRSVIFMYPDLPYSTIIPPFAVLAAILGWIVFAVAGIIYFGWGGQR